LVFSFLVFIFSDFSVSFWYKKRLKQTVDDGGLFLS